MAESKQTQLPVLKVTQYDVVSSFLIALVLALVVSVFLLTLLWAALNFRTHRAPVAVELVEDVAGGGVEDGAIDETLNVDRPEPESPDASLAEAPVGPEEVREALDSMVESAVPDETDAEAAGAVDPATAAERPLELETRLGPQATRKSGSLKGTGTRRPLGMGPGNGGGVARELRWFVSFAEQDTLDEYAKQLDFFGIELGAILDDGKIVYISKLSTKKPVTRTVNSGAGEKRLYMVWKGGTRRQADVQLFKRAGINAEQSQIFQFYPPDVEQKLAVLERDYRKRKVQEIRRTYFSVIKTPQGYDFRVTQQAYLR